MVIFAPMKTNFKFIFAALCLLLQLPCFGQERPKVALVFGGGGAKGAAEIGVLRYIEKSGVKVDYVVGTSIGAIIGSLYASGYSADKMQYLFTTQNYIDVLTTPGGVNQLLGDLLKDTEDINFDSLKIPFRCVATTLPKLNEVVLDHGDLSKAVRASAALPGALKPVFYQGKLLIDGGVRNNLPVDVARAMGADIVIAIDLQQEKYIAAEDIPSKYYKKLLPKNLGDVKKGVDWLVAQPGLAKYNANKKSADIYIHPKLKDYNVASILPSQLYEMIEKGEKAGKKALGKLKRLRKKQFVEE